MIVFTSFNVYTAIILVVAFIAIASIIIVAVIPAKINNPFPKAPESCFFFIDISNKRNVDYYNEIEKYCIANNDLDVFKYTQLSYNKYIDILNIKLSHYKHFMKKRLQQYNARLVEAGFENGFQYIFIFYKSITKYVQHNYQKTAYKENMIQEKVYLSKEELINIFNGLEENNYELTTKESHTKKQRNLMTTELRTQILERDNYTCQKCGNSIYKEPNLLLEIDHIIPVAKGGKTCPSNLQTLCWKCNRTKGTKNQ